MIQRLNVKNFRGLERAEIDLAPITVLTGANNADKSTVAYGLFTLKNILSNLPSPWTVSSILGSSIWADSSRLCSQRMKSAVLTLELRLLARLATPTDCRCHQLLRPRPAEYRRALSPPARETGRR